MKKMIGLFLIYLASATAMFLIGCAKSNDDSNKTNSQACASGYYFYNNSCVPVNNPGGVPTTPGFLYGNGFYADTYSGTTTLRITNASKMDEFFKQGMGICDRAAKNYGNARCTNYTTGYIDMIIQFPNVTSDSLLATFIAQPKNKVLSYGAQLPSGWGLLGMALGWTTGIGFPDPKAYYGAFKNPLQLEMKVSAINNSAGFEARGYGDYWTGYNRTLLAIQVPAGKIEDSSFKFNFMVQGTTAAEGTMSKCRYPNCNLY